MQVQILLFILFFLCGSVTTQAQQILSGLVTNARSKDPIVGVKVTFKGFPAIHAETDFDGQYRIKRPYDATVVLFSRPGFADVAVPFNEEESLILNVLMGSEAPKNTPTIAAAAVRDSISIDGAMGLRHDKRSVVYAYQQITDGELESTGEYNLIKALSAKISGLEVTSTSGMPGSSANAIIRGRRFMTSDNTPLVILDGIPINNSYRGSKYVDFANRGIDINLSDIESVTVLKGASASALYGIDASNGAILLKSKPTGNSEKIAVSFFQNIGFEQVNALPELQHAYAQGEWNTYGAPPTTFYSWGTKLDSLRYTKLKTSAYSQKGDIVLLTNPQASDASKVTPFYNPQGLFKSGTIYNSHVSASGSVKGIHYRAGLGYLLNDGVMPSATFRRYSTQAMVNTEIMRGVEVQAGVNFSNSGGNYVQKGNNASGIMFGLLQMPVTFDLANGIAQGASSNPSAYQLASRTEQRNFFNGIDNPFWSINNNVTTDDVNHLITHAQATYQPLTWLKLLYRAGAEKVTDNRVAYWNAGSNTYKSGYWENTNHTYTSLTSDALATADFQPIKEWFANLALGYQYRVIENQTSTASKNGFTYPVFPASEALSQKNFITREGRQSTFYNLNIQTKNTMYYTVTGRLDWSSTFSQQYNPAFYDSYGAALVFTELVKISDRWLPYGKLRFTYAGVGGGSGTPYMNNSSFVQGPTVQGLQTLLPSTTIGDAPIQPKKSSSLELGLDMTTLSGKILLDIAAYSTTSKAEIVNFPIAPASGATAKLINGGKIQNKGIEANISVQPMVFFGVQWSTRLNFSMNRNKVLEIGDNIKEVVLPDDGFSAVVGKALIGQPMGVLFGTRYQRLDNTGEIGVDNEGYPLKDRRLGVIGNPYPDWLAGWRNSFQMYGFALSFLLDVRAGGDMLNGTMGYLNEIGMSAKTENRTTPVVFEGGSLTDLQPNKKAVPLDYNYYNRKPSYGIAESNIEKTTWVRLRDLSLFYNPSKEWLQDFPVKNFSVGLIAKNPFLWTKYTGIDPETNLSGVSNTVGRDYFNHPNTKSWGFQLKVGF
jgi:TonB-linked SusC/RagA family outer membrane protein